MEVTIIFVSIILTLIICSPLIIIWAIKSSKARNMKRSYQQLRIGMSVTELINLLGSPDSVGMSDEHTKIMQWRNDEGIMRGIFDKDTTRTIKAFVRDNIVISYDSDNINKRTW